MTTEGSCISNAAVQKTRVQTDFLTIIPMVVHGQLPISANSSSTDKRLSSGNAGITANKAVKLLKSELQTLPSKCSQSG